jgi:hypothetical protein
VGAADGDRVADGVADGVAGGVTNTFPAGCWSLLDLSASAAVALPPKTTTAMSAVTP